MKLLKLISVFTSESFGEKMNNLTKGLSSKLLVEVQKLIDHDKNRIDNLDQLWSSVNQVTSARSVLSTFFDPLLNIGNQIERISPNLNKLSFSEVAETCLKISQSPQVESTRLKKNKKKLNDEEWRKKEISFHFDIDKKEFVNKFPQEEHAEPQNKKIELSDEAWQRKDLEGQYDKLEQMFSDAYKLYSIITGPVEEYACNKDSFMSASFCLSMSQMAEYAKAKTFLEDLKSHLTELLVKRLVSLMDQSCKFFNAECPKISTKLTEMIPALKRTVIDFEQDETDENNFTPSAFHFSRSYFYSQVDKAKELIKEAERYSLTYFHELYDLQHELMKIASIVREKIREEEKEANALSVRSIALELGPSFALPENAICKS